MTDLFNRPMRQAMSWGKSKNVLRQAQHDKLDGFCKKDCPTPTLPRNLDRYPKGEGAMF